MVKLEKILSHEDEGRNVRIFQRIAIMAPEILLYQLFCSDINTACDICQWVANSGMSLLFPRRVVFPYPRLVTFSSTHLVTRQSQQWVTQWECFTSAGCRYIFALNDSSFPDMSSKFINTGQWGQRFKKGAAVRDLKPAREKTSYA